MTTSKPARRGASADPAFDSWPDRDLLGLQGRSAGEIRALLRTAKEYASLAPEGVEPALRGKAVALLFQEDSTRTRFSFEIAAKRLGAEVAALTGGTSASKGETLSDTARTIESMGVDAMVVRHGDAGAAEIVARVVACPVVNAGDGRHEHPTQGLLDAYALAEAHGRAEGFDLTGLRIAIVGDISHSRVARSASAAFGALGAEVLFVGPPGLAPESVRALGGDLERDLDHALPAMDAVMALRIQFERAAAVASPRAFRERYGLTAARVARMKPGAVVMHPGPMNRGLEIDSVVADGPRSLVRRQVALGVAVRMGALRTLIARA